MLLGQTHFSYDMNFFGYKQELLQILPVETRAFVAADLYTFYAWAVSHKRRMRHHPMRPSMNFIEFQRRLASFLHAGHFGRRRSSSMNNYSQHFGSRAGPPKRKLIVKCSQFQQTHKNNNSNNNNKQTNMPSFDITNSVAFVTGTNKKNGIGRAIVDALLENGASKVYATARDASQLDDLVAESNGRVVAVSLDVTNKDQVKELGEKYSDVTLVVNNAGYFGQPDGDVVETAEKEIAVNYIAPLAIVKSFTPVLTKEVSSSDEDSIKVKSAVVNVASIASLVNFPLGPTYSASKAASHSLTQGQRRDLQSSLVVGVYPGPIDTDMAKGVPMDKTPPSGVAKAVIDALTDGTEDVFPDQMAVQLHEGWKADAKALEKQMAQPQSAAA